MKQTLVYFLTLFASSNAFQPTVKPVSFSRLSKLNIVWDDGEDVIDKIERLLKVNPAKPDKSFDEKVKYHFPEAITNDELESKVVNILAEKGFKPGNTLLATSLCADELARELDDDFNKIYGNNFNLGGLSGFPFAGNTGFGAMSAHIPDDGYCFIIYGPHVGITRNGVVGKVERRGIKLVDNCCGSAIAASNYLAGITDGGAIITTKIQSFTDFQQGIVQEYILPHGKRLSDAKNRMVELPYALYDSQDVLMQDILAKGIKGTKKGVALLGGIQINTGPYTPDYFHPLRFDYMNNKGEVLEDMLPKLQKLETVEVSAPSGKLGVLFMSSATGVPMVQSVKKNGPMADKLLPGDVVVGIDGKDVRKLDALMISELIRTKKDDFTRKITVLRGSDHQRRSRLRAFLNKVRSKGGC